MVAAKTKKLVAAMTMMVQDVAKIENGHWSEMLAKESQNHNEMAERAGSASGAEMQKTL